MDLKNPIASAGNDTRPILRAPHREGRLNFGDARMSIYEEGIAEARAAGGYAATVEWERRFKRDVFARIVQTLNRLGWNVGEQNYIFLGNHSRYCTKGDLQADLRISGRCITLEFFQNINAPDRADHGGRYQDRKEFHMPYVMRLEMERTRRRIRDYLVNVLGGYVFDEESRPNRKSHAGHLHMTALEWMHAQYRQSWHFKGDMSTYVISDYNNGSADGKKLTHGARVWFYDRKGRLNTGTAYYNINNMWWVVTGRYDVTNMSSCELHLCCPDHPRLKRNGAARRGALERELKTAIGTNRFERCVILRDILFPGNPPLFNVWHDEQQAYHKADFRGYTRDQSKAGLFTAEEVRGWNAAPNRVVSRETAEVAYG